MRLLDWLPWRMAARSREHLDMLQRHGLTASDRRYFEACCRAGMRTPEWLVDRLIAASEAARHAGEVPR
jgi:hypothetical protein